MQSLYWINIFNLNVEGRIGGRKSSSSFNNFFGLVFSEFSPPGGVRGRTFPFGMKLFLSFSSSSISFSSVIVAALLTTVFDLVKTGLVAVEALLLIELLPKWNQISFKYL